MKVTYVLTLKCLIAEHARLTILNFFSILLSLITSCLLNYFEDFFLPACLLDPACLIILIRGEERESFPVYNKLRKEL